MAVPNEILPADHIQTEQASNWLSQVDPAWIARVRAGIISVYPGFERAADIVQATMLLDHFIQTDAAACLRGSLPDIAGLTVLQGTFFVQLEEAFNAAKPIKERLVEDHSPGRLLKLELSDGKRSIVAIEHEHIPDLSTHLSRGAKIMLQGPVTVHRGTLLLKNGNLRVLGGRVAELDVQAQALAEAVMQQPVGRRGPPETLQEFNHRTLRKLVESTAANGANGGTNGFAQNGRPVQPPSPELQQHQPVPQQRQQPDSPRQLPQQQQQQRQQPPPAAINGGGVAQAQARQPQHRHFDGVADVPYNGSISFGSGNVPPVSGAAPALGAGAIQQRPHNPHAPPPDTNGNHAPMLNNGAEASSDEGWSSESDEEDGEEETNLQHNRAGAAPAPAGAGIAAVPAPAPSRIPPAARAAPQQELHQQQQQRQQHQLQQQRQENIEVITLVDEDSDDETQPPSDEDEDHLLPNGQTRSTTRTRVVDSPELESPINLVRNPNTIRNNISNNNDTAGNGGTINEIAAPPPSAQAPGPLAGADDAIYSSSQEDGRAGLSLPYNRNSSGKKKNKRKSTERSTELRQERSTSPQINVARNALGMGIPLVDIPPTEPQHEMLFEEDIAGVGEDGGGLGFGFGVNNGDDNDDNIRGNSEKKKKQRLQSVGKSNKSTSIADNTAARNGLTDNGVNGGRSPRAKTRLSKDFDQVSYAAVAETPTGQTTRTSPLQLPASVQIQQISPLLMQHPPALDQIRANQQFSFPAPSAAPAAAVGAHVSHENQINHTDQHHNKEDTMGNKSNAISIEEWGSQGPQPFTYLFHLAQYTAAVELKPMRQLSTYYPISATVQGSIPRVLGRDQGMQGFVIKVEVEDGTSTTEAVLGERFLLDLINVLLRDMELDDGNDGGGIIQVENMDEFRRLKKLYPGYPELAKEVIDSLKKVLHEHYGLIELIVRGPGESPEIVQLLDASLTESQVEMLRHRVQRHGQGQ